MPGPSEVKSQQSSTEKRPLERRRSFSPDKNRDLYNLNYSRSLDDLTRTGDAATSIERNLFNQKNLSLSPDNPAASGEHLSGNKSGQPWTLENLKQYWQALQKDLNKELPGSSQTSQGDATSQESTIGSDHTLDIAKENKTTLDTVTEKLQKSADTVNELVGWNVEDHFEKQRESWNSKHPEAELPALETTGNWPSYNEWAKFALENHLDPLQETRKQINSEIYTATSIIPKINDYSSLEGLSVKRDTQTQRQDHLKIVENVGIHAFPQDKGDLLRINLREQARPQLNQIKEAIENIKQQIKEAKNAVEEARQKDPPFEVVEHAFFAEWRKNLNEERMQKIANVKTQLDEIRNTLYTATKKLKESMSTIGSLVFFTTEKHLIAAKLANWSDGRFQAPTGNIADRITIELEARLTGFEVTKKAIEDDMQTISALSIPSKEVEKLQAKIGSRDDLPAVIREQLKELNGSLDFTHSPLNSYSQKRFLEEAQEQIKTIDKPGLRVKEALQEARKDPDKLNRIENDLVEAQTKLKQNQTILDDVKKTLDKAPKVYTPTISAQIKSAGESIPKLEGILQDLQKKQKHIDSAIKQPLPTIQSIYDFSSLTNEVDKLHSIIKPYFKEKFSGFYQKLEVNDLNKKDVSERLQNHKKDIDTSIQAVEEALQVPRGKQKFEAMRSEPPDQLHQQIDTWQKKQEKNLTILEVARGILQRTTEPVEKLAKWKPEAHLNAQREKWTQAHHGNLEKQLKTTYDRLNHAGWSRIEIQKHLDNLAIMEEKIRQVFAPVKSIIHPIGEGLKKAIGNINDKDVKTFLQKSVETNDFYWQEYGLPQKNSLLEQAREWTQKIEESREMAQQRLNEAKATHRQLAEQISTEPHPIFRDVKLDSTTPKIPFIKQEEFFAGSVVHMIQTLLRYQRDVLKYQGVVDSAQQIAKVLDPHPYGGNIDVAQLDTKLRSLGDRNGLQHRKIETKYLDKVVGHGPIGVFLFDREFGYHAATLEPVRGKVPRTEKLMLTVHDELRPAPYRISFNELVQKWQGEVFLPTEAVISYLHRSLFSREKQRQFLPSHSLLV